MLDSENLDHIDINVERCISIPHMVDRQNFDKTPRGPCGLKDTIFSKTVFGPKKEENFQIPLS